MNLKKQNVVQDPIGGLWLAKITETETFQPLPVISGIAGRRSTLREIETGFRTEFYQESSRPADTIIAHLQFYLRNEIPHLEFLQRLFKKIGSVHIQSWINQEPTGQYARRAAFLYEWLTGDMLSVPHNIGGNYIDVLNSEKVVTASKHHIEKDERWRVNNNLAGTPDFYPILLKTENFTQAADLDIAELLNNLVDEFGEELILRSSVWLTLRESKSSFKIEGESKQISRIQRFADVIARYTGKGELPINPEQLSILQRSILGDKTVLGTYGIRQSPVFVGQTVHFDEVVHYIAPPHQTLIAKLKGLQQFWQKTEGQSSIMRSAVIAFGFVYIHPLADGNGRGHRFLFNDILRRDGVLPDSIILPISGVIAESETERQAYFSLLDEISKLLMQNIRGDYSFSKEKVKYADGIISNLIFTKTENAEPLWRFPNLTKHVEYLSRLIKHVITHDMHQESSYLLHHQNAREAIKDIIEMPNEYADRIIRSVLQNQGQRSSKLIKEFEFLADDDLWEELKNAVKGCFEE